MLLKNFLDFLLSLLIYPDLPEANIKEFCASQKNIIFAFNKSKPYLNSIFIIYSKIRLQKH